ncbi:MAG: TAXI family TRAP transporter solute-binding subunit [Hyphomicrobiaceae bacterium]|nr:TAXI family TRAP transporter solute-binding subunit [Hyphomicrobiaceae bacterium]
MTIYLTRRDAMKGAAALAAAMGAGAGTALAQTQFFRIGTGGTGGTYYPIGGIIANAISGGTLNASAVASNGSVANVNAIVGGAMESGFSQADVASWAYTGTGIYEGKAKVTELRAIANLYPESVHIVIKKGLGAKTVADLKGKRVSIDEPGSGTLINAKAILASFGITEKDIKPEYLKQQQSIDKLKDGTLDAYVQTTGYPQGALTELATTNGFELLSIDGEGAAKLLKEFKFFSADEIPDGTYKDVKGVKTLSVGAQWVTTEKIPTDVVYAVTKGLWSEKTRAALDGGHAKGKAIQKATAIAGIGIPLHPGAEKFYKEAGLIK